MRDWVSDQIAARGLSATVHLVPRQPAEAGEFMVYFGKSTFENWQSEFLQLFSFVVLAALYTHRGSAESKDSDDRMEAKLDRIVEKLDA